MRFIIVHIEIVRAFRESIGYGDRQFSGTN